MGSLTLWRAKEKHADEHIVLKCSRSLRRARSKMFHVWLAVTVMTVMIHNWLLDVLVVLLALAIPLQLGFPGYGAYPPVDSCSVGVPRRWHWTSRASSTFGSRGLHAVRTWRLWTMTYYDILWHTMTYYDILWHTMTYYDILWHTMTYYDSILFHPKAKNMHRERERERETYTHTQESQCKSLWGSLLSAARDCCGKRRCITLQHCRCYDNLWCTSMIISALYDPGWSSMIFYDPVCKSMRRKFATVYFHALCRLGMTGMAQCSAFLAAKLKVPSRTGRRLWEVLQEILGNHNLKSIWRISEQLTLPCAIAGLKYIFVLKVLQCCAPSEVLGQLLVNSVSFWRVLFARYWCGAVTVRNEVWIKMKR